MTAEDPRWTRSRSALITAVTALLDAGDTPSVTEIVAKAGMSRPTFYQHFGDLPTSYAEAALARVQEQFDLLGEPDRTAEVNHDRLHATITQLVSHLRDHDEFYCTVLREAGTRGLSDRVVSFIAYRIIEVSPLGTPLRKDEASTDLTTTIAAGIFWLISHWLQDANPQPAEHMAERIVTVLLALTPREH